MQSVHAAVCIGRAITAQAATGMTQAKGGGWPQSERGSAPREHQSDYVAQVVHGIRDQGERIGHHPQQRFRDDERKIQRNADRKSAAQARAARVGAVRMVVSMGMIIMMFLAMENAEY